MHGFKTIPKHLNFFILVYPTNYVLKAGLAPLISFYGIEL